MPTATNTLDFQNNSRAINLLDPVNPQDSATKIYVDNSIINIGTSSIMTKVTFAGATYSGSSGNLNILDPTGAGNPTDVRGLNSGVLQTFPNGAITPFIVEGSATPGNGGIWVGVNSYELNNNQYVGYKTPNPALNVVRTYLALQEHNYIRVQYSLAATAGGTSTLIASPEPFTPPEETNRVTLAPSIFIDDVAQSIITSTQQLVATPSKGSSYSIFIPVFAVSGTATPTMAVRVEESLDGGANFRTVYTFPLITAGGIYISPSLPLCGDVIRYTQTITGTNPSFNRSILRVESNAAAPMAVNPRRLGGFNAANQGFDLATQGRVRRITANNRSAAQLFLQIHDSAGALSTGAVPLAGEVYALNANSTVALTGFGEFGTPLGSNPRVAISSTFGTYTLPPSLAVTTVSLFVESL